MKKLSVLVILLILLLTACATPTPKVVTVEVPVTATPVKVFITATPTSMPSPIPRPTPTPVPTLTPFPTPTPPPTPTSLPTLTPSLALPLPAEVDPDDYRAAMRPGSEDDVLAMAEVPRYRLGFQVDLDQGLLKGREALLFTNHEGEALEELVLRLYPNFGPATEGIAYEDQMWVGGVTVDGEPVEIGYVASNTAVVVPLPHPLAPDASIHLELDFAMSLGSAYKGRWELASFYPLLAVYDKTGWRTDITTNGDLVYSESALYVVELALPGDMVVAASGTEVSTYSNPDGTVTHTFLGSGLRDFALAFGEPLQQAQANVDGTAIHLWHSPNDPLVEAKLRAVADAVRVFDRRFGLYPYADLDVVTQFDPEWWGPAGAGVEYPGLTFYTHGEKNWEYNLVHEVAHQWWFSVVGNDVHLEPWLDEALADYSAFIYFQEVHGEEDARRAFQENVLRDYEMGLEGGRISGEEPVGLSVYDFPPMDAMYFWIVYGKGALFLDALRQEMGDEVFFDFLQEYYRRYKYGVATGEGFLEVAEQVAGRELDDLYDAWVRK